MNILSGIQNVSTVWVQYNFRKEKKKKQNCDFCFCKHSLKDILVQVMQCSMPLTWRFYDEFRLSIYMYPVLICSLFSVITKEQFTLWKMLINTLHIYCSTFHNLGTKGKVCIWTKGPAGRSLSLLGDWEYLYLPPGWDASSMQGYPQHWGCCYPFKYLGGEKQCE